MPLTRERVQTALADRYDVERELGRGGMAVVWLARDRKHHRWVGVKVLLPEIGVAVGTKRFLREIEISARLTHPHILPLFDSGTASGLLYYVMPWIEGESLRQLLARERQLTLEDALRIARQVGDALDHAHRLGIVHRDVKPGNILLAGEHAYVADFGLARAVGEAGDRLTQTGFVMGTQEYMSPEQAAGDRELDARTDVYSLGCVVYEMLAGRPPFTGPNPQAVMRRRLAEAPAPLRAARGAIPVEVEAAIARALARSPADRFPSVHRFLEALDRGAPAASGSLAVTAASRGRPAGGPRLIQELRRREVFDTALLYMAVAWVAVQVTETTYEHLGLPEWTVTAVLILAGAGLPVALALSWAFEITREGLRRTSEHPATEYAPRWWVSPRTLLVLLLIAGAAAAAWWLLGRLIPER